MKIKLLFILILFLLKSCVVNAAEIYNKNGKKINLYSQIGALQYFSDKRNIVSNQPYVLLGFKGETQVNNQLIGYGQWEYQIKSNISKSENQSWMPVALIGIKFLDVNYIDYGYNCRVINDVTSWTNVIPKFNNNIRSKDEFLQPRSNGLVTYRNKNLFGLVNGLNFAVQYQVKKSDTNIISINTNTNVQNMLAHNRDSYGASLTYDLGNGFSIGSAVALSKFFIHQNAKVAYASGIHAKVYSSGLKYNANNIYLAAQCSQSYRITRFNISNSYNHYSMYNIANEFNNFELAAQYQFGFGLRPTIAYVQSKVKSVKIDHDHLLKYVYLGTTYPLNKDMSTYVVYKLNLADKKSFNRSLNAGTDTVASLGLVYQF